MAHFDTIGSDDDFFSEPLNFDCPICGKSVEVLLDPDENFVICPNCGSKIEIDLSQLFQFTDKLNFSLQ